MFISLMRALIGDSGVACPQHTAAGIRFAVWAPNAQRVEVLGDWDGWAGNELHPVGSSGIWAAVVDEAEGGQFYKFRVTGAHGREVMKADPMAAKRVATW